MHHRPLRLLVLSLALFALVLAGCKVTTTDVEAWKGTVKGPGKLVAVVLASKYSIELRAKAAVALIQMERSDVNGSNQLQGALQRLTDEAARTQIIDGMADDLIAQMRGQGQAQAQPAANGAASTGPTPAQIRAKDAAFELIAMASPQAKTKLTDAVVGWYVEDYSGRSLSGNYSAEQVIRALGSHAAELLVAALNSHMPQPALIKVSELIGAIGDANTKRAAAERLIAIEREMESDAFMTWLKDQIRPQLAARGPVNEERLTMTATINRENYIRDGAISAMKFLADQPQVSAKLLEIASTASGTDENLGKRRKAALQALEGKATQAQLAQLLNIALDMNNPADVRDYAFDRVGDIRSAEALPRLWPLVASNTDQRLRWRVGELVLAIGGAGSIAQFVATLPSGADAKYAPEELAGYATRMGQMTPLPADAVRPLLHSPHWFLRVLALRFFERKGTASDVAALETLKSDTAAVHGPDGSWQPGFTVGKVAESAIAGLRTSLQQPAH